MSPEPARLALRGALSPGCVLPRPLTDAPSAHIAPLRTLWRSLRGELPAVPTLHVQSLSRLGDDYTFPGITYFSAPLLGVGPGSARGIHDLQHEQARGRNTQRKTGALPIFRVTSPGRRRDHPAVPGDLRSATTGTQGNVVWTRSWGPNKLQLWQQDLRGHRGFQLPRAGGGGARGRGTVSCPWGALLETEGWEGWGEP